MPDDRPEAYDRRRFLKLAALAGIGAVAAPVAPLAQTPPAPTGTAPAPATPPAPSDEARALTEQLRKRYPDLGLDAAQWEAITRDFEFDLGAGKRLRGAKLANSDEPDFTFRVKGRA